MTPSAALAPCPSGLSTTPRGHTCDAGVMQRMTTPGKAPLPPLIDVTTGADLGEDDVIRYDDVSVRRQGEQGCA